MTPEEKISRTKSLLEKLPPFGEFKYQLPKSWPLTPKISGSKPPEENLAEQDKASEANKLSLEEYNKDDAIIQELINGGFIINRHDIKVEGEIYRQLTDKGRELKELGSMEEFNRVQELKNAKIISDADQKAKEAQRNKYMFYITLSIGISTGVAALYYFLEILRNYFHWFHHCV